jgi:tRNA-dihydrouridine synthase B
MKPVLHLAPLHGLTNFVFRNSYFRHFSGFDCATTPFIISKHRIDLNNKLLKDILPENNALTPVIPQILSNNPRDFLHLSRNIIDLGYTEINWNLGCPFPMVADKQRGSGLLPYPEKIESFLETVFSELNISLSLKIRLGRETADEIFDLIPVFNKFPLKKIIIHPRTGVQMYEGRVDLEKFSEAAKLLRHEIVYNGDITDLDTFRSLKKQFGFIREWMIGRGALINPVLPEQIKTDMRTPAAAERILAYHDELVSAYSAVLFGPVHVMDKMKEIWSYLGRSFTNSEKIIRKISKSRTMEEYDKAVDAVFEKETWVAE